MNDAREHQDSAGQEMQPRKGLGQTLVIAGKATEARHPGERALDNPATLPLGRIRPSFRLAIGRSFL